MKKILKRAGIIFLCFTVILIITFTVLFWSDLRSLASIKKVDDYGMFQMTYYGDYGFDNYLKIGAESDSDIEDYVTKHLLKGLPIRLNVTGGGCTAFIVRSENGDLIYGRNFDFSYAPSIQVITNPKNGYASISTVNLSFVGYSQDHLPSGLNFKSFLALTAPYLPFDGMNEKGVAIAILAIPEADPPYDENKVTLNTTTAVRLVLDKAATVDEAIELLKQYNIYFSDGIDCHFLIADASGQSVLIEYYDGGLQTVTTDTPYQVASNFIAYNDVNIGDGFDEFERYDIVHNAIEKNGGIFNEEQAKAILAEVGVIYKGEDRLQWTVVYNLTSLTGTIFAHRNTNNLIVFQL